MSQAGLPDIVAFFSDKAPKMAQASRLQTGQENFRLYWKIVTNLLKVTKVKQLKVEKIQRKIMEGQGMKKTLVKTLLGLLLPLSLSHRGEFDEPTCMDELLPPSGPLDPEAPGCPVQPCVRGNYRDLLIVPLQGLVPEQGWFPHSEGDGPGILPAALGLVS